MKSKRIYMSLVLVIFAAFMEILVAYPIPLQFYVAFGLFAIGGAIRENFINRRIRNFILPSVFIGIFLVLYTVHSTPRKRFVRDLGKINKGMSEHQVRSIMHDYIEGTGLDDFGDDTPFTTGTLNISGEGETYETTITTSGELMLVDSLVFRHANSGDFNADWGIVQFDKGRVSDVEFSRD